MTVIGTTLVLGGARSGKSRQAEGLIRAFPRPWIYIATAEAGDDEMRARISRHRADRGSAWRTVEAPLDLPAAIRGEARPGRAVLVDCLTLWLSNLMLGDHDVARATTDLLSALAVAEAPVVLVSNEVGQGIVPDNPLARAFRDEAGRLNQAVAAVADTVLFMIAGLPMRLKGTGNE